MNGSESDVQYAYRLYQPFTNVHRFAGFSGNGRACAGSQYPALSPPMWPGNKAITHTNTSTYNNGSLFLVCLVKFQHLLERVVTDDVTVQHKEGFRVLGQ